MGASLLSATATPTRPAGGQLWQSATAAALRESSSSSRPAAAAASAAAPREQYNNSNTRESSSSSRPAAAAASAAAPREQYNTSNTNGRQKVVVICTAVLDAEVTDNMGKPLTPFVYGGQKACVCEATAVLQRQPPTGDDGRALFQEELTEDKIKAIWRQHVEKALEWSRQKATAGTQVANGTGDASHALDSALVNIYTRIVQEKTAHDTLAQQQKCDAERGKRLRAERTELAVRRVTPREQVCYSTPVCNLYDRVQPT